MLLVASQGLVERKAGVDQKYEVSIAFGVALQLSCNNYM